ncbi:restriction endonuclease subunit S [Lacinutrix sp. MEBiC02404]
MMEGWDKVELGDICAIKGGKRLPKGHELLEEETNHKYIRARDIKNGKINFDQPVYINEETFNIISRYIVNKGDVIITIVGANIGDTAFVTDEFDLANLTENAVKLISKSDKVDSLFLKYALVPDYMKYYFQTVASGAAQDKLGIYKIKKIKINLPPLKTQRKIASILSGYDDLIENNLKRIKLLEEQAQQTYEEWFVRFKFPGYESVEIDAVSGLPFGWEKNKLDEFTNVLKGKNITKATIVKGNVPVVAGGLSPAYYHNKPNTVNPVITVSASGANAGFVNMYLEDVWASDCSFIDSKMTDHLFFVYCTLINQQQLIYHLQKGAAQPHVYPKDLKKVEIIVPSSNILQKFENLASNNFNAKRSLFNQNQYLKEARDILLPRLMSGLVDVDSL